MHLEDVVLFVEALRRTETGGKQLHFLRENTNRIVGKNPHLYEGKKAPPIEFLGEGYKNLKIKQEFFF